MCSLINLFTYELMSPLTKQLQFDDTSKIDIRYTLQRIVTKQEHTLEGTIVSMFSIYYIKQIFALTIKFKGRHTQDCCQTPCSPCCFLCKRLRSQDCYRLPGGMIICRSCICKRLLLLKGIWADDLITPPWHPVSYPHRNSSSLRNPHWCPPFPVLHDSCTEVFWGGIYSCTCGRIQLCQEEPQTQPLQRQQLNL